ncbi:hypothetical protein NL676_029913 [Syzygium grande]|nr:hypothetical protein NL676_029913 [Syzygium grande]
MKTGLTQQPSDRQIQCNGHTGSDWNDPPCSRRMTSVNFIPSSTGNAQKNSRQPILGVNADQRRELDRDALPFHHSSSPRSSTPNASIIERTLPLDSTNHRCFRTSADVQQTVRHRHATMSFEADYLRPS